MQDAYVFTVVGNPLDTTAATSYKLAAPGHTLGTLTNDALTGVVGTLGAPPGTVPLTVRVKDMDTGAFTEQRTNLVDETDLGDPDGQDALSAIASLAVAQGVTSAFDGAPAQETGRPLPDRAPARAARAAARLQPLRRAGRVAGRRADPARADDGRAT